MKRPPDKGIASIGDILTGSLTALRTRGDGEMARIWDIWNHAVGEAVSQNTRPAAFKGHLLQVNVSSSSWLHHLNFQKKELIEKINQALGKPLVRDLTFKIGKIHP